VPAADHRLTTREMAQFVVDGFLRFDALIPDALNARVSAEMQTILPSKLGRFGESVPAEPEGLHQPASLTPLSECYPAPSALGELLRLPEVQGIVKSLVGADPLFDHDFVHFIPPHSGFEQHLHMDAILDSKDPGFDIQLFYFPNAVAPGEGGTRFVPGTHLRRVRAEGISRYQRIRGEEQYAGPAGTLLAFHHGLWHAGQANPSDTARWMYKIRLNPRVLQRRLWNTDDLAALHNDPSDHVFASVPEDSVGRILRHRHPWQAGHEERYDLTQRVALWRHLSGDAKYDVDYYLTRLEQRDALNRGGIAS
jgi:hypothetical protein